MPAHTSLRPRSACVTPKRMQVAELLVGVAAPVLYWEQGHEWLFGDPVRFQAGHLADVVPLSLMLKLGPVRHAPLTMLFSHREYEGLSLALTPDSMRCDVQGQRCMCACLG